jgi:hypothetical protein
MHGYRVQIGDIVGYVLFMSILFVTVLMHAIQIGAIR